MEHIRGHLWHRYSITVNQVMVATIKLSSVQLLVAETYIGMEQSQVIIVHLLAFFYQDVNIVLYTIVYLLKYLKWLKWKKREECLPKIYTPLRPNIIYNFVSCLFACTINEKWATFPHIFLENFAWEPINEFSLA